MWVVNARPPSTKAKANEKWIFADSFFPRKYHYKKEAMRIAKVANKCGGTHIEVITLNKWSERELSRYAKLEDNTKGNRFILPELLESCTMIEGTTGKVIRSGKGGGILLVSEVNHIPILYISECSDDETAHVFVTKLQGSFNDDPIDDDTVEVLVNRSVAATKIPLLECCWSRSSIG